MAVINHPLTKLAFDPLDPGYVSDPYPLFSRLRESEPIHKSPGGAWVLTRYEDIVSALGDRRLGNTPSPFAVVSTRNKQRYICADVVSNILPFIDVPKHTAPRKLISKTFFKFIARNPPDVETIANNLIQKKLECKEMDVLHDYATPLSVSVMAQVLGFPAGDESRLKELSEWFFYLFSMIPSQDVREKVDKALIEFREYISILVDDRRRKVKDDLISDLLNAKDGSYALSEPELIDTCILLFADGVENPDRLIANATAMLLHHPEQLAQLKQNPELITATVNECLRFESPAQFIGRVALEDLIINNTKIVKYSIVLLVLGSANRDSKKFESADQFNIQRNPNPYLSFGKGKHSCIGGSFVRLEVERALQVLIQRLPNMSLKHEQLDWAPRLAHRWLANLPVKY